VTPYPQVVTAKMLANFAAGGAAINVLARQIGARVVVADMGVAGDVSAGGRVLTRKIALGTDNIAKGPAMSAQHSHRSVEGGIEVFEEESGGKLDLVGTGDMGIGNTTPSAAVIAAFTGLAAQEVTGRGTGVDDAGLALKVATVERALTVNDPDPADALDVLAKLGGFEIGGLAGVMLAAAAHRAAVVIDGLISGAAALVAVGLEPKLKDFLIAGHLSTEPGHRAALAHLGLEPLLNLEMRLGEGTGAALAMAVVEAAARLLNEMATFEEAGVSEATEGPCGGC
jgi:nicotinate-nucleotide--dimethylbenzimidazole phosphoribosyltransferase